MRLFIKTIVILALAVGLLSVILPRDLLIRFILFRDFFDMALPILAFGALVKYLLS